jgi:hypothetical protein
LGQRGLLTFDLDPVSGAPTVQIAHESLLVHWSRMADWIEDLRQDLWIRRHLAQAADEWQAADRSPGFLAAGSKLERFETWARGTRLRLADQEKAFLLASAGERDRLAALERERSRREQRLERRSGVARRLLVGVLAVALVLAGTLVAAVLGQQRATDEASDIATARELAAGSVGTLGTSRQLSVLLALQAADTTAARGYVVEQAYDALQWSLQEAQVQFPAGQLPIGVRRAPEGPRGVYLVAPEVLMRLAAGYVRRSLTADECRTYVHAATCSPVTPPGEGEELDIRAGGAVLPAESLAVTALIGTHVRVLSELPLDVSPLLADFEQQSGIALAWDAVQGGDLKSQIDARDLPDLAIIARPSYLASAAHDGWLLRLDGLADLSTQGKDAGEYAVGLGTTADGKYGAPLAASVDDLLWYPRDAFAAAEYSVPKTRGELDALLTSMKGAGPTPWCFGSEAGSNSGAAAAVWIENLLLDAHGPQTYDRWVSGEIQFDSPEVNAASDAFGRYVASPGDVYGGLSDAVRTAERIAALPMLLPDGPGCWLYRGSSTDLTGPGPNLAEVASAVPFPGADDASVPVLGRVYMVVALRDRPEVRQALAALLGEPFASALAATACDDGIFPMRSLPPPEDCSIAPAATRIHAALQSDAFRVLALDTFPAKVAAAFLADLRWYLDHAAASGQPPVREGGWAADGAWAEMRAGQSP